MEKSTKEIENTGSEKDYFHTIPGPWHKSPSPEPTIPSDKALYAVLIPPDNTDEQKALIYRGPKVYREKATKWLKTRTADYHPVLTGEGGFLTCEEQRELIYSQDKVPVFQWRTYSMGGAKRTSGFTGPDIMLPNAHWHNICGPNIPIGTDLWDLTKPDGANSVGAHLTWQDPIQDILLSFTNSLIFIITHALRRHELGQEDVYIAFGNTRKLATPDGGMAPIYPAISLIDVFEVESLFELNNVARRKFHRSHFTHESLSAGEIRDPEQSIRHVLLERLIKEGFLEYIPELRNCGPHERSGLYEHQVAMRKILFYEASPKIITKRDLVLCERFARLFAAPNERKAPFYAFVNFLGMRKRPGSNPMFERWVLENYDAQDIFEGIFFEMNRIPVNCPDVIQSMKLIREAITILNLSPSIVLPIQEILRENQRHYSEDGKHYMMFRNLDKDSQELYDEKCYENSPDQLQKRKAMIDRLEKQEQALTGKGECSSEAEGEKLEENNSEPGRDIIQREYDASEVEDDDPGTLFRAHYNLEKRKAVEVISQVSKRRKRSAATRASHSNMPPEKYLNWLAGRLRRRMASCKKLEDCHNIFIAKSMQDRIVGNTTTTADVGNHGLSRITRNV